jgi:propanol-preferring alcohol dehydrogenase
MRAAVLREIRTPLELADLPVPEPGPGQLLVKVHACGVCRTDLHIVDGELVAPRLPLVPGHQIVGTVEKTGAGVGTVEREGSGAGPVAGQRVGAGTPSSASLPAPGTRVGIPWLGWTCGQCQFCASGRENLCERARFTGFHIDGGFAEYAVADARFCFPIPEGYPDLQAAPLLCAGLIGYRALRMAGDARTIGFYGFGSAAHIIAQVARHQVRRIIAFTRPGDIEAQSFACELGAAWAGGSTTPSPEPLEAAIIFASDGSLVPKALHDTTRGGTVVCAGIHMSDIPGFAYRDLWEERSIRSVANLTREDAIEFLELAPKVPVKTTVTVFPLEQANEALSRLRSGELVGSAVLSLAR